MSFSGKALQWFHNDYFFVFLAVDLGKIFHQGKGFTKLVEFRRLP
jgi:hypothetical protein